MLETTLPCLRSSLLDHFCSAYYLFVFHPPRSPLGGLDERICTVSFVSFGVALLIVDNWPVSLTSTPSLIP